MKIVLIMLMAFQLMASENCNAVILKMYPKQNTFNQFKYLTKRLTRLGYNVVDSKEEAFHQFKVNAACSLKAMNDSYTLGYCARYEAKIYHDTKVEKNKNYYATTSGLSEIPVGKWTTVFLPKGGTFVNKDVVSMITKKCEEGKK